VFCLQESPQLGHMKQNMDPEVKIMAAEMARTKGNKEAAEWVLDVTGKVPAKQTLSDWKHGKRAAPMGLIAFSLLFWL
jgi:hypothetical protein